MMIKCAMKTSLGRRQPNKPIRDGLQAYAVCESKGRYCYVQWIDVGKNHDPALMGAFHLGWFVEMVCLVLLGLAASTSTTSGTWL